MYSTADISNDFSKAALHYDVHATLQASVLAHCVDIAIPHIAKQASVLDAGCGTGKLCEFSRERGLDWRITGADIAEGMCHYTSTHHGIPVIHADLASLPVENAIFDGVISSLVLQWVDQCDAVLAEMARVLKPEGIVVISTLLDGTLQELDTAFSIVDSYPHISQFGSIKMLKQSIEKAGMELLEGENLSYQEYYPDLRSIMHSLKLIGARNKRNDRKRGLTTPKTLKMVEEHYKKNFQDSKGLPLTWNVGYCILRRQE